MLFRDYHNKTADKVALLTAFGIALTGVIVIVVTVLPLHRLLMHEREEDLLELADARGVVVEEYVARALSLARSVATGTEVKKQLTAYRNGALTADELSARIAPLLESKLAVVSDVFLGMRHYAPTGKLLLNVGLTPQSSAPPASPQPHGDAVTIEGPVPIKDKTYFLFGRPLYDETGTLLGTNLFTVNVVALQKIVNKSTHLGASDATFLIKRAGDTFERFFPASDKRSVVPGALEDSVPEAVLRSSFNERDNGALVPDDATEMVYASSRILRNVPWKVVIRVDSAGLYMSAQRQFHAVIGAILLLSLLGLVGSLKLIRPLVVALQRELDQRRESERRLRTSEEKYRTLFSEMLNGFAHHEIVTDAAGRPIDYTFKAVNAAFEKLTGLHAWDILGKRVTEVIPGIKEESTNWIEIYGRVALTGETYSGEVYSDSLRKWYNIHAFSAKKGFFSVTFEDITQRKKGEREFELNHLHLEELVAKRTQALSTSKREWELTFDAVHDFISIHDQEGRILNANQALRDQLQITTEALIGQHCRDVFHCTLCGERCAHEELLSSKAPCDREGFSAVLGCHVVANFYPIIDDQGVFAGSVRVVKDISEQRAAAETLTRQNALLESTFAAIPESVVVTNLAGTITLCNPGLYKMFGYAQQDVLGKSLSFLLEKEAGSLNEWLAQIPLEESPPSTPSEADYHRADGSVFPGESITRAIRNRTGEATGFLTLIRDISERKAAEHKLLVAKERLDFALVNGGIGFYEWDVVNDKVTVNAVLQAMLGHNADDDILSSSDWRDKIHPDDKRKVYYKLTAHFREETLQYSHEQRLRCRNGEYKWFWNIGRITERDREGGPLRMVGICIDVSLHKELEIALTEAKELAESTVRAKSDFLANMSHEIRTPINAIIGMSHLVLTSGLTPSQLDYIRKIDNAARLLLDIVGEVLDFSKIELGKLNVERTPFSLDLFLDELSGIVALKAKEKGLELLFKVATDIPPQLISDSLRLKQVLVNLLDNAIKFTSQGEVVLAINVIARQDDQLRLRFNVRDTGVGINAESLSRLFEPFTQADTSTTRNYGGTGLGLAISKRLIELMGGTLTVKSRVGVGSDFSFELPCREEKGIDRERLTLDLSAKKALVVDDNETPRTIIRDLVETLEMNVVAVDSGSAALSAVRAADSAGEPFDVVFIDWQMPDLDGVASAHQIKAESLQSPPRMILVSARNFSAQPPEPELFAAYLPKPLTRSLLLDGLSQAFADPKLARQRRNDPQPSPAGVTTQPAARGARILLAEDNEINQQITSELLRRVGMSVVVVNDGVAALEQVQREVPDLVLMDVQMPRMDGLTATGEIRKLPDCDRESLPILALTAHAQKEDQDRSMLAGMNAYLVKPIDPEALYATIYRWLQQDDPRPGHDENARVSLTGKTLPATLPGLDVASALSRQGGDVDFMRRIMGKFARFNVRMVGDIARALECDDFIVAGRLAHTLKSAGGYIGADQLCDIARELERACKAERPADCAKRLKQLTTEMALVSDSIEQLSQGVPRDAELTPEKEMFPGGPLPGLNLPLGLKRTGDHRELYLAQLNVFAEYYRTAAERDKLSQAFAQKDYPEVARLAHNMKSMAGNLGAEKLYEVAVELEDAMRHQRTTDGKALLQAFAMELATVLSSIEQLQAPS